MSEKIYYRNVWGMGRPVGSLSEACLAEKLGRLLGFEPMVMF